MTLPLQPLRPILSLVLLLSACSHSDPFTPHDSSLTGPLVAGLPIRLTYNPGGSLTPGWDPDGTHVIYAFSNAESRQQNDQCLGLLPRGGGTQAVRICNDTPFASDSTDTFSWPAISAGRRLAYVRATRPVSAQNDLAIRLVYGSLDQPSVFSTAFTIPFQAGTGVLYPTVTDITWLDENRLAVLGLTDTSVKPCPDCGFINVRNGRDILLADLTGETAVVTPVSGTAWATSVAAAPGDGQIYFTLAGSSQVFQKTIPDGPATAIYDFGTTGIVRDVHAAAGQLVAVVGGVVKVINSDAAEPIQQDSGGRLFVVDLASATARELPRPATLFRNPALAPDGGSVVAEGHHFTISSRSQGEGFPTVVDTVLTGPPDLWEFPLR